MTSSDFSDVFISYRRLDVDFTRRLVEALQAAGREVWIDWEDIPPASTGFSDDIKRGLDGADAFICVLTPAYLESRYTMDLELQYAIDNNKKIIPVVLERVESSSLPDEVRQINWIFFLPHAGHENRFEDSLAKVLQALDQDLEHARFHKRLFMRALEWDGDNRINSRLLTGDEIDDAERWLTEAPGKTPEPTPLHRDYVRESRQYALLQQRRLLMGVSTALVVSLVLLIAAVLLGIEANQQRILAEDNEATAIANEDRAIQAEATAVRRAELATTRLLADQLPRIAESDHFLAYGLALSLLDVPDLPDEDREAVAALIYDSTAVRSYGEAGNNWQDAVFVTDSDTVRALALPCTLQADDTRRCQDPVITDWTLAGDEQTTLTLPAEDVITVRFMLAGTQTGVVRCIERDDFDLCATFAIETYDSQSGDLMHSFEVADNILFNPDSDEVLLEPGLLVYPVCETAGDFRCADNRLDFIDLNSGESAFNINTADESYLSFAAISDDGGLVAAISEREEDGLIVTFLNLIDTGTGEPVQRIAITDSSQETVSRVSIMPDAEAVLVGYDDGTLKRWLIADGTLATTGEYRHNLPVDRIVASDDGNLILSTADFEGRILTPDELTGGIIRRDERDLQSSRRYNIGQEMVLAVSDDLQQVITRNDEGRLILHDLEKIRVQRFTESAVSTAAFMDDSERIMGGSMLDNFAIWQADSGEQVFSADPVTEDGSGITTLSITPDSETALFGINGGMLVYDLTADPPALIAQHTQDIPDWWTYLIVSPDGSLAAGAGGTDLTLWDLESGERLLTIPESDMLLDVAFSPDSTALIGIQAERLAMWDVSDGNLIREADLSDYRLNQAVLSAETSRALLLHETGVTVWDTTGDRVVQSLDGHQVIQAAISPDHRYAMTAGEQGLLYYWNLETGTLLRTIPLTGVSRIILSADHQTALAIAFDTLYRITLTPDNNTIITYAEANRQITDLTCDLRERYNAPVRCDDENTPD